MRAEAAGGLRHEFIGLYGMVERNWYLIKRYAWWEIAFFFWTAANTLTIVFIAKGVVAEGGQVNIDRLTTILLIGAVIWSYLGIVFELLIETVAWERWEGTIEYTFMAALTRAVHLLGTGIFAIGYGIVRASGSPTADLARERDPVRLRRAGSDAGRVRRLLPGLGAADVHAVDREGVAGDVRVTR